MKTLLLTVLQTTKALTDFFFTTKITVADIVAP